MTDKKQPEALHLADRMIAFTNRFKTPSYERGLCNGVMQELRRLHAENTALQQDYAAARLEIESLRADLRPDAGVIRIVWKMEGDARNPVCEARAMAVVDALNAYAAPTPKPAPRQGIGKVVHQFRKQHCAEWYDGHADHSDGRGPYEERTLYTPPSPASQGDALDAVAAEREACAQECLRQAGLTVPSYDTAVACAAAIRARAAQEGKQ